ncbi:MAG TPA: hypothetical protein VIH52_04195 [Candidatus Nanoarchaeia archaeon]
MIKYLQKNQEIIFLFILVTLFGLIGLAYVLSNSLQVYDAPGHLNLIWYLKEYLWPNFSGWNSFTLLGFEQGVSYPPLFHYLAANLSFVFGIELAVGLLIVLSLIVLPLSVYYFARSVTNERGKQLVITSFLLALILVLPGYLGANLKALTQIGLLPSFVSLPLVFFYLGSIKNLEQGKVLLPTVLLSAVILTHLVAGLFSLLFLFGKLLTDFFTKSLAKSLLTHLIFTALITSFFWVPFLLNYGGLSVSAHPVSLDWPNLLSLIISASFLISFINKRNKVGISLAAATVLLSWATLGDSLVQKYLSEGFLFEKVYNFHLYRFQVYQYLLLVVLVALFLAEKTKKLKLANLLIFSPLVLAVGFIFLKTPLVSVDNVKVNNFGVEGRFLETFRRTESYPLVYAVQSKLVSEKGLPWAYGLFTDATANGPYLGSLIKSLRPDAYEHIDSKLVEDYFLNKSKLADVLDLFAISSLFKLENGEALEDLVAVSDDKNFYLEPRKGQSFVEIPKWKIRPVFANWSEELEEWWTKDTFNELLVFDPEKTLKETTFGVESKVQILDNNKNWTKFTFEPASQEEVPVLVKFGYSPNWKAFQEDKKLKIYKVSPSLMLVQAKGKVKFEYQNPQFQTILVVVSLVSLPSLFIFRKRLKLEK